MNYSQDDQWPTQKTAGVRPTSGRSSTPRGLSGPLPSLELNACDLTRQGRAGARAGRVAQVGVPARQGGWTYKTLSVPEAERPGAGCAGGRGGPQLLARRVTVRRGHCPRIGLLRGACLGLPLSIR